MSGTLEKMRRLWLAADTKLLSRRTKSYAIPQYNKALVKLVGFEPTVLSG
jgi:hypothetical protein